MNKYIQTIRRILHYGQLESLSHTQNRKIINVNFASLIAIASTLLYSSNLLIFIGSDVAIVNFIASSTIFWIFQKLKPVRCILK
jgi:hypothetical protein